MSRWRESITKLKSALPAPNSQLLKANSYIHLEQLQEAEALLREIIDKHPNDSKPYILLGRVQYDQRRLDECVAAYQKSIELNPKVVGPYINMATALTMIGRYDEAGKAFEIALTAMPKDPGLLNRLGYLTYLMGKPEEAIIHFRRAAKITGTYKELHTTVGLCLAAIGETNEAIETFRIGLDLYPDDAEVRANLIHFLHNLGRQEEAEAEFQTLSNNASNDAAALETAAAVLYVAHEYEDAGKLVCRLMDLNPPTIDRPSLVGMSLKRQGCVAEADGLFREELKRDGKDAVELVAQGIALHHLEQFDEAIAAYQEAGKLRPFGKTPWIVANNVGTSHLLAGRLDQATEHFQRAIELDPKMALAYSGLGGAYRELDRLDESESMFLRAIEIEPRLTEAHLGFGRLEAKRGNIAAAIRHLERAVEIEPSHQESKDELAKLNLKIKP